MHSKIKAENAEMISNLLSCSADGGRCSVAAAAGRSGKSGLLGKGQLSAFSGGISRNTLAAKPLSLPRFRQGDSVGFFLARSIYDNLEILKLGVFPEYQRQGIGTQLMETAYAEGIRRGCNRCFLEVRKSNQTAIQFYYHRHNFRIAGTRLNYYTDPVEDAWIMERAL